MSLHERLAQKVINATGHSITFDGDGEVAVLPSTKYIISCRSVEEEVDRKNGIALIRRRFEPKEESTKIIQAIEELHPGKLIIGSVLAAQAYPGKVFALVPAFGFENKPPNKRRAVPDQLITFKG